MCCYIGWPFHWEHSSSLIVIHLLRIIRHTFAAVCNACGVHSTRPLFTTVAWTGLLIFKNKLTLRNCVHTINTRVAQIRMEQYFEICLLYHVRNNKSTEWDLSQRLDERLSNIHDTKSNPIEWYAAPQDTAILVLPGSKSSLVAIEALLSSLSSREKR